jgi:hypothetical protein
MADMPIRNNDLKAKDGVVLQTFEWHELIPIFPFVYSDLCCKKRGSGQAFAGLHCGWPFQ